MEKQELANFRKAGEIGKKVKNFAESIIKKNAKLLDIAEKIESNILELGGKPGFPVNLSINDIAAHFTPSWNDETLASGLLKIDMGVGVDGCVVDFAFSVDLENSDENAKLIKASEEALEHAGKIVKKNIEISEIGKTIKEKITEKGFSPIINLSGHEIKKNNLHAGVTIPNHENGNTNELQPGVYAIEPFATTGTGRVYEGKSSGIYKFVGRKPVRDSNARKILNYIEEEYSTLPFCARWIVKKFNSGSLVSLRLLEQAGCIHQFPQLIEQGHGKVSQAETTVIVSDKVEILV